jgi:hypothetical protein
LNGLDGFYDRPHPDLLPREKEQPLSGSIFANDYQAISVAGISVRRQMILLLLGEKAGMRES